MVPGEDHKWQFDPALEKQATFTARELLVLLVAAQRMAYRGGDDERVANAY
ncbi:hypothetical protein [Streptomyces sp. TLI_105]|uniref:hypothetical protein n=1 Tax=Streptomyces sp. TLI_105 TaxID=1881019 RepID=UPI0008946E2B|nr:hypothetical protein [Streptomyces sp. TLI_105]SEB58895.1 hypothetical protein SAMN05428939_0098 [Streptomyces sp. TLI_105]